MRKKLVAGNWKMHGNLDGNQRLLDGVKAGVSGLTCQVAVCVPYPYLVQAQSSLAGSQVAWGAQNVSEHAQGAFTGEVAVGMLGDFGCRYAIVGHSERSRIRSGNADRESGFSEGLMADGYGVRRMAQNATRYLIILGSKTISLHLAI